LQLDTRLFDLKVHAPIAFARCNELHDNAVRDAFR
jgi:hypothetical protein